MAEIAEKTIVLDTSMVSEIHIRAKIYLSYDETLKDSPKLQREIELPDGRRFPEIPKKIFIQNREFQSHSWDEIDYEAGTNSDIQHISIIYKSLPNSYKEVPVPTKEKE